MNWNVVVTKYVRKQMVRVPRRDAERIQMALLGMKESPFQGDIVKLGGDGDRWRRRVGNYRILFNVLSGERTVFVYDISRCTSGTY